MSTANPSYQVFKFGGTSVGSAEAVRLAAGLIRTAAPRVAAVVSAMSGITDQLLGAAHAAVRGEWEPAEESIRTFQQRHVHLIAAVLQGQKPRDEATLEVERAAEQLRAICRSLTILQELTPRTLDMVVAHGERQLARIFTALLNEAGVRAAYVDATRVVRTMRRSGSLWPDFPACAQAAAEEVLPLLSQGQVVIMPGFIGSGPSGEVVTLGRSGSDFSATILARSIGATSVTLYKEVDGLMTADPRDVPGARVVPELHFREAAELAYYGAKVLHPRTMIPLIEQQIPLYIRNTFNPASAGTRIAGDVRPGAYPVKALSAVRGQALISVEGNGMMGVPGIAARAFAALSQAGHSVSMISQASSEASICLVVPEAEADHAERALQEAFSFEISARLLEAVRVERPIALVSVVGLGMRGVPGIAARTFSALSHEQVNVVAIAQGSSELNITVALKEADTAVALRALHAEYQLSKLRALPNEQGREASLVLLGLGQIGQSLARQLSHQARYFQDDLGLRLRCVAIADRSGVRIDEEGLPAEQLAEVSARKAAERKLFPAAQHHGLQETARILRERLFPLPFHRPVLVDLTAADTGPLLREALSHGCHVVLANKKPLAVPQAEYDALLDDARARNLTLRYEATVGAGLPVLDTLSKLREVGDQVLQVQGCLSGTLGYLMTQLEQGVPFSAAVRKAYELGYMEPDPREDLSGMDVARKALILARTLGHRLDLSDIRVTPLFAPELSDADPARFLDNLSQMDRDLAQRIALAREQGRVLRYVARIDSSGGGGIQVGLEAVPESSPMGRLRGTDNQIVLYTQRYRDNPLVVTGPGAGADVTAAGVLNDILAIAVGQDRRPSRSPLMQPV